MSGKGILYMERFVEKGHLSEEDILELIRHKVPEDQNLEYKSGLAFTKKGDGKKIAQEASSFANSDGGILIVGIKDEENEPKEIDTPTDQSIDGCMRWAARTLASIVSQNPICIKNHALAIDKKTVLVICVTRSSRLISVPGEHQRTDFWFRMHDSSLRAPDFLISDLILGRRDQVEIELELGGKMQVGQSKFKGLSDGFRERIRLSRIPCLSPYFTIHNMSPKWTGKIVVVAYVPFLFEEGGLIPDLSKSEKMALNVESEFNQSAHIKVIPRKLVIARHKELEPMSQLVTEAALIELWRDMNLFCSIRFALAVYIENQLPIWFQCAISSVRPFSISQKKFAKIPCKITLCDSSGPKLSISCTDHPHE